VFQRELKSFAQKRQQNYKLQSRRPHVPQAQEAAALSSRAGAAPPDASLRPAQG
jgi:hypothetical protein